MSGDVGEEVHRTEAYQAHERGCAKALPAWTDLCWKSSCVQEGPI